ncbi:MepB family protein [Demequina aurantiaca]|uniref:MepB family protein n=1 Tax=Demequina aurantiaca TaxID=676200 RepID=UPI003D33B99E
MTGSLESFAQRALVPAGIEYAVAPEPDNAAYSAAVLTVGTVRLRVREARVTPTKPGAFVSVWRRAPDGGTEPFPAADAEAGVLVFVAEAAHTGVFHFTPAHLAELGVVSTDSAPGKRGFRVYPPWCHHLNPQATRAQRAQASAFIDLAEGENDVTASELLLRLGLK